MEDGEMEAEGLNIVDMWYGVWEFFFFNNLVVGIGRCWTDNEMERGPKYGRFI